MSVRALSLRGVLAVALAAGCGSPTSSAPSSTASSTALGSAIAPASSAPSYPFLACPPKDRVVSLRGWMTGILRPLLGACAVDIDEHLQRRDPLNAPEFGGDKTSAIMDEVLREPPANFFFDSYFGDDIPAYRRLVAAGSTPHVYGHACNVDRMREQIRHMGAAIGKAEVALELADRVQRDVTSARAAIPAGGPRPSVLFVRVNFSMSPSVYGDDCMREMLRLADLTDADPEMNGWRSVTKDDFETADVIIALTHVEDFAKAEAAVRRAAGVDEKQRTRARLVVVGDWTVRIDARVAEAIGVIRKAALLE